MVVIKKLSNIIPVDFGEFQLEYVANDENIKRMKTIGQNLEKRAEKLKKQMMSQLLKRLTKHLKIVGQSYLMKKPLIKSINFRVKQQQTQFTI